MAKMLGRSTLARLLALFATLLALGGCHENAPPQTAQQPQPAQEPETRGLVGFVNDAAKLVQTKGEAAFADFRTNGSRWRKGERYIFVLDTQGDMLVHPDPTMEGKNQIELKDVNGKPIIRGLIGAATLVPSKREGWYHYEWPVPGGLLPRWKSSFVELVKAPSGKSYVVGSGVYTDRMEKSFVVDEVNEAVALIEKSGTAAFPFLHDEAGPFIAKDAYVFVIDPTGVELVNPAFPNLEGRSLLSWKDSNGKEPIREMLNLVQTRDAGWVEYMWPKPGESVATQKSAYVRKAKIGDQWLLVGCGAYLADAPKSAPIVKTTAPELMQLVRDGATLLEKRGDDAYPELRTKGSKWYRDDTYFFVWKMDGTRVFHAADPSLEGQNGRDMTDILGRPYGKMFLEAAQSPSGEGWVHYMYPEPGNIFPAWKSTFVKRVTFPSGEQRLVGSGVYNMQMDRAFIEDVVNRASALVAAQGKAAFPRLRDKTGPFVFMDTYVFVDTPDGKELVNGGQPSLEGRDVMDLRDVRGKLAVRDYIEAATKSREGSAWTTYEWYRPDSDTPAPKQTFVRRVQSGPDTFIVGSGFYSP